MEFQQGLSLTGTIQNPDNLAERVAQLRLTCGAMVKQGGEAGEIAGLILEASTRCSKLTDKIDKFLRS